MARLLPQTGEASSADSPGDASRRDKPEHHAVHLAAAAGLFVEGPSALPRAHAPFGVTDMRFAAHRVR